MNTIVKYITLLLLTFITIDANADNHIDDLVKHAVEQLDKLYAENTYNDAHGKHDDNWYIYILGGTVEDLIYVKDEIKKTFTPGYLNQLNELLKKVNKGDKAAVYVAFTNYTSELITPIFPSEYNTFSSQELYINQLLENSSDRDYVVQLFRDYKALFNNTLKRIYNESLLSESAKANIFMPFMYFEKRTIINNETATITNSIEKYKTYTLYTPKKENFVSGEYRERYKSIVAQYGKTDAEVVIERVVRALNDYYYAENIDYKECQELLTKSEYQKYLNQDKIWREVIDNNPCILYHIQKLHGDYIGDTEFAKELRMIVNRTLLGAMAIPVMAIVGEYALYDILTSLVDEYGAEKVREVSQAAITNIVVQAVTNYYFDENSYSDDKYIRMQKAIENIDKISLAQDVFVAVYNLNMRSDLILTCITGGLEFNEEKWYDVSEYDFDLTSCVDDVGKQLFWGAILKTGGVVLSKVYRVAKDNPKMFINGYRKLLNDTGDEGLKAFKDYLDEIKKAFDINDKNLIGVKLDVEAKYANDVKQFIPDYSFANLTKDVISDVEFNKMNLNSGITKIGVNTELDFPKFSGNIRPTILTELSDGSYNMVFVVNKNVSVNSIDDLIKNANITGGRKEVLNTFQSNTKAILRGGNSQKYFGKRDVEINIKGVEVYTIDANGNPVKNEIEISKNSSEAGVKVANAGGDLDNLFPLIKNHPDFQGFKNLCTNNPKVSIKLAGDEWAKFVTSTKSTFGIGSKRNIVKMEFDGKEYLIASGKGYNGQMTGSGKFIPEEFVLDIDKGQRVFTPSISTRHLDTESLGLEYFAKSKNAVKGVEYPNVTGKVKITSDLCPCPSCSAIFQQFSDMFPNVTIDITTTTKLHY